MLEKVVSRSSLRDRLESANFLWSIQRLAGKLGFRIVRSSLAMQDMEPRFLKIYSLCSDFTMTSIERMYALYKAVEHLSLLGFELR